MAARLRAVAVGLGGVCVPAALIFAGVEPLPVALGAGAFCALDFYPESIDPGALRVLADPDYPPRD